MPKFKIGFEETVYREIVIEAETIGLAEVEIFFGDHPMGEVISRGSIKFIDYEKLHELIPSAPVIDVGEKENL